MLKLYDKTFSTLYGTLSTVTKALVEEERNGLFELSFTILNTDSLFKYIEKENIVVCNANDTLLNQKFRIYNTRKLMNNKVAVFARHISFDLMYDHIDNLSFENQSCEYALNELFRLSNFSQHYKGYSDIVNAQNYNVSECNVLEAIGGIKGSILDTFGTGAEILRDNENIHVLSKRGYDNSVTIEYRKNLTGFELEEDTTDLVTRILPYAKYTPEGGEETTVKASYVDSPLINNYSHPFIKSIDYTDKFENEEIPTIEKLVQLAEKEYTVNKVDIPKQNYKIEFIPLSKCVGYEALNDRISLCDTVTIKDTRYNVNTQAKVIKTTFNVLKNRYESIELGEPRTSLGDIISSGSDDKVTEEQVKDIVSSTPSTNYPNTLPKVPTLESFVYGFANIELRWTFENKVFYAYEVYASKTKGFTPNTFDLIYQGQASSYMFQAQPNETWYFKVCGINSYNKRTAFSNEVEVVTTKIEDLSNYVSEMAIGDALIGDLNLGRGWVGQLNANLLDVKGNFSVTDGNGARTMDIDSFGNVNLNVSTLQIRNNNVYTVEDANNYIDSQISMSEGNILLEVSKKSDKNELISLINLSPEQIKIQSDKLNLNGYVTVQNLQTPGETVIDGGNIKTGTIEAMQIKACHFSGKNMVYIEDNGTLSCDGYAYLKHLFIPETHPGWAEGTIGSFSCAPNAWFDRDIHVTNEIYTRGTGVIRRQNGVYIQVDALGIQEGNPSHYLLVNCYNSEHVFGVDLWYSDEKLKENIVEINNKARILTNTKLQGLDLINSIIHYTYNYKQELNLGGEVSCGYIAQQLQSINDELVREIKQNDGTVNLEPRASSLIPHITLAMQQQQEQINSLNEQIKLLKEEIKAMKEGV